MGDLMIFNMNPHIENAIKELDLFYKEAPKSINVEPKVSQSTRAEVQRCTAYIESILRELGKALENDTFTASYIEEKTRKLDASAKLIERFLSA